MNNNQASAITSSDTFEFTLSSQSSFFQLLFCYQHMKLITFFQIDSVNTKNYKLHFLLTDRFILYQRVWLKERYAAKAF
ncbi:hypothetical protein BV902_13335 [Sphingobacterium sp. B29]|nr:hypothetical protein BV902_13335 [Sphingobacterium sp. B29]